MSGGAESNARGRALPSPGSFDSYGKDFGAGTPVTADFSRPSVASETPGPGAFLLAAEGAVAQAEALQDHLFTQAQSIFGFGETVTLYDLTNSVPPANLHEMSCRSC